MADPKFKGYSKSRHEFNVRLVKAARAHLDRYGKLHDDLYDMIIEIAEEVDDYRKSYGKVEVMP